MAKRKPNGGEAPETPVERLLAHLGMSQTDFAASLGCKQDRVSRWCSGTTVSGPYAARILGLYHRQMKTIGVTQQEMVGKAGGSQ